MILRKPGWMLLLLMLAISCSESDGELQKNTPPEVTPVKLLDQAGLTQLISERNGRALLINVWATWCVPCREEFPDLIRLAEEYKNRPLDLVALSADYPDEVESKAQPFLEKQPVNFPVYVQDFPTEEAFINYMNPEWSGALPATFIYDSTGVLQSFLLGRQHFSDFRQALQQEVNSGVTE
ncbi:MAG: TlpA disulfide reductase family protein [Calditrichia bacterium]